MSLRLLLLLAVGPAVWGCGDDSSWRSSYGEGCQWYAENDVGCTKFADVGQLQNCNATCDNCDWTKPLPDPLITTCKFRDLCDCFEKCHPTVPCPVGADGQPCRTEVRDNSSGLIAVAEVAAGYLELRLTLNAEIHAVDVQGAGGSFTPAFRATVLLADGTDFPVDTNRTLPGNWDTETSVRTYFRTPLYSRRLRLWPLNASSSSSMPPSSAVMPLRANLVVKSCPGVHVGARTPRGRCDQLKCKSYCYNRFGCVGDWQDVCTQTKEAECNVDCSAAGCPNGGAVPLIMALVAALGLSSLRLA